MNNPFSGMETNWLLTKPLPWHLRKIRPSAEGDQERGSKSLVHKVRKVSDALMICLLQLKPASPFVTFPKMRFPMYKNYVGDLSAHHAFGLKVKVLWW